MTTSQRKRRAELYRRVNFMLRHRMQNALDDEWDRMPAIGREFGSPDFDRLMEEDYRLRRGIFDPRLIASIAFHSSSRQRRLVALKARLTATTRHRVMGGTRWLSEADLYAQVANEPGDYQATLTLWLEQRRLFALQDDGVRRFPEYAFDENLQPVPTLKDVLDVLEGCTAFQIAAWFESPTCSLNGKRPRELLSHEGAAVIAAARQLKEGAVHG